MPTPLELVIAGRNLAERELQAVRASVVRLGQDLSQATVHFKTGEITIHATPEERGGVFDPRLVDYDEIPVQQGTHTVTLTITRREGAADFLSVTVRVCISTIDR